MAYKQEVNVNFQNFSTFTTNPPATHTVYFKVCVAIYALATNNMHKEESVSKIETIKFDSFVASVLR